MIVLIGNLLYSALEKSDFNAVFVEVYQFNLIEDPDWFLLTSFGGNGSVRQILQSNYEVSGAR